jgi:hypothetical protein
MRLMFFTASLLFISAGLPLCNLRYSAAMGGGR